MPVVWMCGSICGWCFDWHLLLIMMPPYTSRVTMCGWHVTAGSRRFGVLSCPHKMWNKSHSSQLLCFIIVIQIILLIELSSWLSCEHHVHKWYKTTLVIVGICRSIICVFVCNGSLAHTQMPCVLVMVEYNMSHECNEEARTRGKACIWYILQKDSLKIICPTLSNDAPFLYKYLQKRYWIT